MLSNIINPVAMLFTLTTAFGVFLHDTQIDNATKVAITVPAAIMAAATAEIGIKATDSHVHVERVSAPKQTNALRTPTPRQQPRDDDKKHLQNKKSFLTAGGDSMSLWPSV